MFNDVDSNEILPLSVDNRKNYYFNNRQSTTTTTTTTTTKRPKISNSGLDEATDDYSPQTNEIAFRRNRVSNNAKRNIAGSSRNQNNNRINQRRRPASNSNLVSQVIEKNKSILRLKESPAYSVQDVNSILLFCDFDYAKCPIRITGDTWNYTVRDTPGFGRGFASVVTGGHESNLYIRAVMTPTSRSGDVCVHFRFVLFPFSVDGGTSKTKGIAPDGKPFGFSVTAGSLEGTPKTAEFTEYSDTATDWLTGRVQFNELHSSFLLIFQVARNPLQDNLYLAIDDILVTQGLCHT